MGATMSPCADMQLESVACPCGSRADSAEAFRTPTRCYRACPECGLVFRSPRPDGASVEAYYTDEYDSAYGQAEAGTDREPVFESVLRHLGRFVRPPGRLLDIGCGDGQFLLRCRSAGWTCFGIELSRRAAARAAAKGLTMLPRSWITPLNSGNADGPLFDVITLINVLETVSDPLALLTRVRTGLGPDGYVAVRVTNGTFHLAMRRWVRLIGAQYHQAFHLFMFSPSALTSLMRRAGFEVLSIRNSCPSDGMVHARHRSMSWWLWFLLGQVLWRGAEACFRGTHGTLVWAPSFELIATPTRRTR